MRQLIDEYGREIPPYRIMGTDADYSNRDVVDMCEETFEKLKSLCERNNLKYTILKVETEQERYYISEEKELKREEPKYCNYLKVDVRELKNEYGAVVFNIYFKVYEFNDGNYGFEIVNNNRSSSFVCMGYEGVQFILNEKFIFSEK